MGRVRAVALDDYQGVVRTYGPWHELDDRIELVTIDHHIADRAALIEQLAGAAVVLVMRERTRFDREVIASLPDLRLLVNMGLHNAAIDLEAAADHGVVVSGTLHDGHSTAETTWALILALTKHLVAEDRAVRAGGWQHTVTTELFGRTLGVIGLGKLGSKVATIGRAFDMDVVAWSQNLDPDAAEALGVRPVSKEELLRVSDVVTLHLKLGERSRGVIGAPELRAMRPSAVLVNTSRGPLVDEAALLEALRDGTIAGAGLDVYDVEPLPTDHPLRSAPNTVLSPHLGYVTDRRYEAHFTQAVENIAAWLDGAPIRTMRP